MAKIKQEKATSDSKEKTPKQLQDFFGFKVIPVLVNENTRHFLYMRKHESKSLIDESIKDRTLFLLNLPFDTTPHHIRKLFKDCKIAHITFSGSELPVAEDFAQQKKGKKLSKKEKLIQKEEAARATKQLRRLLQGGSSAHIVFTKEAELENALNMNRVERKWSKDYEEEQPLGLERYILAYEYSRPDPVELQQDVDTFMHKFKADEYEKERQELERMNQMDDDGFTVVVRHKKQKNTDGSISVAAVSTDMAEAQRHKSKKKELVNFYRFQMRDKKQKELNDLRKRFEEDKAKIAHLKQNRKFKPY
ncbi:hypothetical protein K501DRAFT_244607 [Backusella circina FSU 941]|nr:hypothetical protein K501DRAFT_244607 [Backusella circina FSU 941]